MNRFRIAAVFALAAACWLAQAAPAQARGHGGDETRIFQNVDVGPDETVDGNLNVLFGDATVEGVVRGDCNAVFGTCSRIGNGQILGNTSSSVTDDAIDTFVPPGVSSMAEQDRWLIGSLASSAVVVLVFFVFPTRTRIALGRVEQHPALAGLVGALGFAAVIPLAILLACSIIGIPLIFVEAAALFAGVWIGTGAIALLVGRRLCEQVMPHVTPTPLIALVLGLVVVSAAEIVPIVGWIVMALVWCVGFGAAILSFMRSAQLDRPIRRGTIGGPPMTRSF